MKTAGIVAEYNPFHTGHAYQIARTRGLLGADCAVVAVMSGNWVQRGAWRRSGQVEPGGAGPWPGGADLVLELPTVWAASSAESFATGAVALLRACGVVDVLSFGSESGDPAALAAAAALPGQRGIPGGPEPLSGRRDALRRLPPDCGGGPAGIGAGEGPLPSQ